MTLSAEPASELLCVALKYFGKLSCSAVKLSLVQPSVMHLSNWNVFQTHCEALLQYSKLQCIAIICTEMQKVQCSAF